MATTAALPPSSASMRSIMPSMAQAAPNTAPDFMHSIVPEPMTRFGASSEMRGSSEAAPESASSETAAPGSIAPPSSREFGPMTVIVVAVPMSMMMTGG